MKYFFVVAALWVVQVALGAIVAHYGVEGGRFYAIPLAKWLPHTVARTEPFDDLVAGALRAQFAQKPVNLSESASQVPPDR